MVYERFLSYLVFKCTGFCNHDKRYDCTKVEVSVMLELSKSNTQLFIEFNLSFFIKSCFVVKKVCFSRFILHMILTL